MKLLLVQGGFGAGGAEKVMAMLAAHRAALGDEVTVAGMDMPPGGSFFEYPPEVRLTVLAEGAPRDRLLHLRRVSAVHNLMRGLRPDLTISFLTKVNCIALLAARGLGVPVIISERNNPRLQSSRLWRRMQNLLGRGARAMVMQTQDALDDLPAGLRRRACVIANPCAPIPHHRPRRDAGECRFVAVGRLDRQKGFDMLIRAFAAMPGRSRARLTIFGQGPERAALTRQIDDAGLQDRIALPGLANGPAEWLSDGDALVMSSRFEGFPNVLAEAACSGLPIISFDCAYGPSEIVTRGQNGILVPPGDIEGLSRAMNTLATQPGLRKKLGQGADSVADRLSPERIMAQWDALIEAAAR